MMKSRNRPKKASKDKATNLELLIKQILPCNTKQILQNT